MIRTVWSVTFLVSDMNRSKRFYEKTLGMEKKYEYSTYVGFECGGVEIGLSSRGKAVTEPNPMSPRVELLVDDVGEFYRELRKKGVKFKKKLHNEQWGGKEATLLDPDGNALSIVQIDWEKYYQVSKEGARKRN